MAGDFNMFDFEQNKKVQYFVNILRTEIFAVDWSDTCKFHGINFRDLAIYLRSCGINFRG